MDAMKELLESWKVGVLASTFEEFGYNIDSLTCVDDSDLKTLFGDDKKFYGPLKLFRKHHSNWLNAQTSKSNAPSPPTSENKCREGTGSWDEDQFNLNDFLAKGDHPLLDLKKKYDEERTFIHEERLELANIISDELIKCKYTMSIPRFIEISKQIATVFELEDVAEVTLQSSPKVLQTAEKYYGKRNGRSVGILYTQYYNRLAAATKKKNRLKRRRESSSEENSGSTTLNDEVKAAMEWMAKNNPVAQDDEEAEQCAAENWRYCYEYRNESIKSKSGDVDGIMKMWPVLENSYGVSFIEDDCRRRFGVKSESLKSNWHKFSTEHLKILRKMHVCPTVRRELKDLINGQEEIADGLHDIRVIFAMLHLMEPQSTTLKDKTKYRPTIPSTKERLLNVVLDESYVKRVLKMVETDRKHKQLNLYPMIFGIGDIENITEFTLRYKEVCYPCDNFIEALDTAFKFHIFFDLPFSPEHKRFWAFLNGLFYKLETPLLDITVSIRHTFRHLKFNSGQYEAKVSLYS